jgi:hypothetical protein
MKNKIFILNLLLFMNKMFILYFALLQSERGTTKKKSNIYKFMFKYVESRKFTETTFESASYPYTVRVHCINNNKKKLKNLFDFEYLKKISLVFKYSKSKRVLLNLKSK